MPSDLRSINLLNSPQWRGQWETERGAPLRIGGIPDEDAEETRYALEIPKALSFLAHSDFNAEIMGLKAVPRENRPPVAIVHCRISDYGSMWTYFDCCWRARGLARMET